MLILWNFDFKTESVYKSAYKQYVKLMTLFPLFVCLFPCVFILLVCYNLKLYVIIKVST